MVLTRGFTVLNKGRPGAMVIVSNSLYVSREFEPPSKGPVVYSHEKPYRTVVLQISEIHECQISPLKTTYSYDVAVCTVLLNYYWFISGQSGCILVALLKQRLV